MQGYILHTQKVRDEDLLVKVLTQNQLYTLYRFYGARHSVIHLGNKIDFTIEQDLREIGKLREPMHLGNSWERDLEKRYYWQQYLSLLGRHLHDITQLDSFYFEHLEQGAKYLLKENPKRAMLNLYVKLLDFEGRINPLLKCLICEKPLGEEIAISRAIVCGHKECLKGEIFKKENIMRYLHAQGEFLSDEEVDKLWNIIALGL